MSSQKSSKFQVPALYSVPYKNDKSARTNYKVNDDLLEYYFEDGKTLHHLFMRGVKISGNKPCCGWRLSPDHSYKWITYNEVLKRSKCFGSGLISVGAKPNPSQFIGILSGNRVESILVVQACNCYSMVIVPIGKESLDIAQNIMQTAELKILVIDTALSAQSILSFSNFSMEIMILMEEIDDDIKNICQLQDIKIFQFSALEAIGNSNIQPLVPPRPEDLHTIVFSNETTGSPKGVMLTHKNMAVSVSAYHFYFKDTGLICDESQVYISFFPVSCILEMLFEFVCFSVGSRIGFYLGNRKNFLGDVQELKPTLIPLPPKLVRQVYDSEIAKIENSKLKSYIFRIAMNSKMKLLNKGILTKKTIWDYLVFRKIRKLFGGKVQHCCLQGFSLDIEILNFMRCALGSDTTLVYGLNETSISISATYPCDFVEGSVGSPFACTLVKLVDAPDKNCFVRSGSGEVCVKGANVFPGYYNDENLTKAVIDEDGWFHSGDIGTWLDNGCLKLIHRRKSILVLSDQNKIIPGMIELVFLEIPIIHQIFVYGNEVNDYLVAVVVPDKKIFSSWCNHNHIHATFELLYEHPQVNLCMLYEMQKHAQSSGLKSHEIPRKIMLSEEEFSHKNELLTDTGKLLRFNIYIRYQTDIENMFV